MRDHYRFRTRVADRERPHDATRHIDGRNRITQKSIGGFVFERQPILRPPLNAVAERLDQIIGTKNLALIIENQGGETKSSKRFACDTGSLKLKPR